MVSIRTSGEASPFRIASASSTAVLPLQPLAGSMLPEPIGIELALAISMGLHRIGGPASAFPGMARTSKPAAMWLSFMRNLLAAPLPKKDACHREGVIGNEG